MGPGKTFSKQVAQANVIPEVIHIAVGSLEEEFLKNQNVLVIHQCHSIFQHIGFYVPFNHFYHAPYLEMKCPKSLNGLCQSQPLTIGGIRRLLQEIFQHSGGFEFSHRNSPH
jgi:hypothetical protein